MSRRLFFLLILLVGTVCTLLGTRMTDVLASDEDARYIGEGGPSPDGTITITKAITTGEQFSEIEKTVFKRGESVYASIWVTVSGGTVTLKRTYAVPKLKEKKIFESEKAPGEYLYSWGFPIPSTARLGTYTFWVVFRATPGNIAIKKLTFQVVQ